MNRNLRAVYPSLNKLLTINSQLLNQRSGCLLNKLAFGLYLVAANTAAMGDQPVNTDKIQALTEMGIESLLQVKVTSVAKKSQSLMEAAAAVYIITAEDIQRSGHTSIAELLRLVPGMDVARINNNQWAISARGFNELYTNQLLVLIDGRSVYSPLFGGVSWSAQDYPVENIEKIEVIRGPGGSLWGANAVNGVVNITTKRAKDTQGGHIQLLGGNQEQGFSAQYSGALGQRGYFRLYSKASYRDDFEPITSNSSHYSDQWKNGSGGFRADFNLSKRDDLTVQADYYHSNADTSALMTDISTPGFTRVSDKIEQRGANALLRFKRVTSLYSDWKIQAYIDINENDDPNFDAVLTTADIEFQNNFLWKDNHSFSWGAGYRRIKDELENSFTVSYTPDHDTTNLYNIFIQDEIKISESVALTVGSKLEHNDDTQFEHQPSIRAVWQPTKGHALWGAVSKAVRTPSRTHTSIQLNTLVIPGAVPLVIALKGSPDFESEDLIAYELGYRGAVSTNITLDVSAFFNDYDDLLTAERSSIYYAQEGNTPYLLAPYYYSNKMEGETFGVELAANWQLNSLWLLKFNYQWLAINLHLKSDSNHIGRDEFEEEGSPNNQFQLHSIVELSDNIDWNTSLYYVGHRSAQDIDAYTRLDMGLGWRFAKDLELDITAQNLLDNRHLEFSSYSTTSAEIPRSIYAKLTWSY